MKQFKLDIFYPSEDKQELLKFTVNRQNDETFKVHSYECNRGIAVIQMNITRCFCPPAYYGPQCQFFSDRISIIVHLDQKREIKKISNQTLKMRAKFLFKNQMIDDHVFDLLPQLEKDKIIKHKFYLLYSRSSSMIEHKRNRYFNRNDVIINHPYSIHFNLFVLQMNETVEEIGSWHYPFYFDHLPVFRLAVVLKFPLWFENATHNPCLENSCNENSICTPIFNENNSYYCSCRSGYYGINCSMYESLCENYCSSNALCRVDTLNLETINKTKISCICPLNYFGTRCNLKNEECHSNPCLNDGTCSNIYDRSGENDFLCNCTDRFYGLRCEMEKSAVHIHLNFTKTFFAQATMVQFYNLRGRFNALEFHSQKIHRGIPLLIKSYYSDTQAPEVGILKIYKDLSNPEYFLMYILSNSTINLTLSPVNCPYALSALSKVPGINHSIPSVFNYHHICRNDNKSVCFYDENYFCRCQRDNYRADCFINDVQYDRCDKCLSGGKCLRGDLEDSTNFLCFCPSCYQGERCEFNMEAFGFSLDSLLIDYSRQVKLIYVGLVCLLFLIGLFNNLCSFVTFKRSAPRKFGVGNYLLVVTCLNQIALFFLLFKFIEITIGIINLGSCKVISYCLSVMTRLTYWLTSWISVDRLLIILFPTSLWLKNSRLSIGVSMLTLIIVLGMHVHEIIDYTMIEHLSTGLLICVTNFNQKWISTYNRISTLIHYLCPFATQIICITLLIILVARSRVKTTGQKMTFGQVLKKQFHNQKELYITPLIIIASALPQTILTFSFACTQLNHWQRHTLFVSYLLSYIPQVLGFILYVLPSTTYKKQFFQTRIGTKYFKWMSKTKQTEKTHRR